MRPQLIINIYHMVHMVGQCVRDLRNVSGALWRRGGKRKESLKLRIRNLNICIEKVDVKC